MQSSARYLRTRVVIALGHVTRRVFRGTRLDFDATANVSTRLDPATDNLRERPKDVGRYEPVQVRHFNCAMAALRARLGGDLGGWQFIDIGSGKGRAVLLAARHPFARVIGIERDGALDTAARRNLADYRGPVAAGGVEFVCGDVTEMKLPAADVVLYLYNPFGPPLFERFLDHVEREASGAGRVLLVYSNPLWKDLIAGRPRWRFLAAGVSPVDPVWWGTRRFVIFELDAGDGPPETGVH